MMMILEYNFITFIDNILLFVSVLFTYNTLFSYTSKVTC
jgi:hypothetical protein